MKNLKKAAEMSAEKWIETISDDIPEAEFSVEHEKEMQKIFNSAEKQKHYKSAKTAFRIAVAAVLTVIILIVSVNGDDGVNEYTVTSVYGRLVYTVDDPYDGKLQEKLSVGYMPDDYVAEEEITDDYISSITYSIAGDELSRLHITKHVSSREISIGFRQDADRYYTQKKGAYEYVVFVDGTYKSVVWNNETYVYWIYSPICELTDEELLEIAYNVK